MFSEFRFIYISCSLPTRTRQHPSRVERVTIERSCSLLTTSTTAILPIFLTLKIVPICVLFTSDTYTGYNIRWVRTGSGAHQSSCILHACRPYGLICADPVLRLVLGDTGWFKGSTWLLVGTYTAAAEHHSGQTLAALFKICST